jgi:hypothetical protein
MKDDNIERLKKLAVWIKKNWQLNAKMVRRSSPKAMEDMNNRRKWGPEAFCLSKRDEILCKQLVVLVYFDGKKDYEVCAYPQKFQAEIKWKPKPFGDRKRMTFDPKDLNPKFRFNNINHFKKEFKRRFP